jgi:hypothetical protein
MSAATSETADLAHLLGWMKENSPQAFQEFLKSQGDKLVAMIAVPPTEQPPRTWREFQAKHGDFVKGGTILSHKSGNVLTRMVFADGAVSDGNEIFLEPSTNPRELALTRLEYLRNKLKQEESNFHSYRTEVHQQAAFVLKNPLNCILPSGQAPDELRAGRERILKLRAELNGLEEQIAASHPHAEQRKFHLAQMAEQQSKAQALMQAVSEITI